MPKLKEMTIVLANVPMSDTYIRNLRIEMGGAATLVVGPNGMGKTSCIAGSLMMVFNPGHKVGDRSALRDLIEAEQVKVPHVFASEWILEAPTGERLDPDQAQLTCGYVIDNRLTEGGALRGLWFVWPHAAASESSTTLLASHGVEFFDDPKANKVRVSFERVTGALRRLPGARCYSSFKLRDYQQTLEDYGFFDVGQWCSQEERFLAQEDWAGKVAEGKGRGREIEETLIWPAISAAAYPDEVTLGMCETYASYVSARGKLHDTESQRNGTRGLVTRLREAQPALSVLVRQDEALRSAELAVGAISHVVRERQEELTEEEAVAKSRLSEQEKVRRHIDHCELSHGCHDASRALENARREAEQLQKRCDRALEEREKARERVLRGELADAYDCLQQRRATRAALEEQRAELANGESGKSLKVLLAKYGIAVRKRVEGLEGRLADSRANLERTKRVKADLLKRRGELDERRSRDHGVEASLKRALAAGTDEITADLKRAGCPEVFDAKCSCLIEEAFTDAMKASRARAGRARDAVGRLEGALGELEERAQSKRAELAAKERERDEARREVASAQRARDEVKGLCDAYLERWSEVAPRTAGECDVEAERLDNELTLAEDSAERLKREFEVEEERLKRMRGGELHAPTGALMVIRELGYEPVTGESLLLSMGAERTEELLRVCPEMAYALFLPERDIAALRDSSDGALCHEGALLLPTEGLESPERLCATLDFFSRPDRDYFSDGLDAAIDRQVRKTGELDERVAALAARRTLLGERREDVLGIKARFETHGAGLAELGERLNMARGALERCEAEAGELNKALDELGEKDAATRASLSAAREEAEDAGRALSVLEGVGPKNERLRDVKARLEEARRRVSETKRELDGLDQEIESLRDEASRLSTAIGTAESELASQREKLSVCAGAGDVVVELEEGEDVSFLERKIADTRASLDSEGAKLEADLKEAVSAFEVADASYQAARKRYASCLCGLESPLDEPRFSPFERKSNLEALERADGDYGSASSDSKSAVIVLESAKSALEAAQTRYVAKFGNEALVEESRTGGAFERRRAEVDRRTREIRDELDALGEDRRALLGAEAQLARSLQAIGGKDVDCDAGSAEARRLLGEKSAEELARLARDADQTMTNRAGEWSRGVRQAAFALERAQDAIADYETWLDAAYSKKVRDIASEAEERGRAQSAEEALLLFIADLDKLIAVLDGKFEHVEVALATAVKDVVKCADLLVASANGFRKSSGGKIKIEGVGELAPIKDERFVSKVKSYLTTRAPELFPDNLDAEDAKRSIAKKARTSLLSPRNILALWAEHNGKRLEVLYRGVRKKSSRKWLTWAEMVTQSGGEKSVTGHQLAIALASCTRRGSYGARGQMVPVFFDAPFNSVSTPELIKPIFELYKSNRIQLLAVSDNVAAAVQIQFPSRYQLRPVRLAGGGTLLEGEQVAYDTEIEAMSYVEEGLPAQTRMDFGI